MNPYFKDVVSYMEIHQNHQKIVIFLNITKCKLKLRKTHFVYGIEKRNTTLSASKNTYRMYV